MDHVRLAFINPSYLDDVKESLDVVESQACQRLISEDKYHRPRSSTGTSFTQFWFRYPVLTQIPQNIEDVECYTCYESRGLHLYAPLTSCM